MHRIILAISLICNLSISFAVGTQFPFNGTLIDPVKGKALSGTFDLQFAAYHSETGGAPVGATVTVPNQKIKKGAYAATLDLGSGVFNGGPVWVEVSYQNAKKPAGYITTTPRVPVSSVPYAQVADFATTAGTALTTLNADFATTASFANMAGAAFSALNSDTATTASYAVESLLASHATTADSATNAVNATNASHAAVADSLSFPINAIPGSASAFVTVQVTADPAVNGENLHQAYAAAKALTPNSQPLSATNRASLIVVPGKYYLYAPLTLDAEFVDLVGLTTNRESQHLYGRSDAAATATLAQTASNVRIQNLLVELPRSTGSLNYNSSDPAAYFPETNLAATIVQNCEFKSSNSGSTSNSWSMRFAVVYSGRFDNCTAGNYSFGCSGTASGTFNNCTAGNYSYGAYGTASGTFSNCTGGITSFGSGSSGSAAGGRFYHCIGGANSFTTNGSPIVIGCVRGGVAYP